MPSVYGFVLKRRRRPACATRISSRCTRWAFLFVEGGAWEVKVDGGEFLRSVEIQGHGRKPPFTSKSAELHPRSSPLLRISVASSARPAAASGKRPARGRFCRHRSATAAGSGASSSEAPRKGFRGRAWAVASALPPSGICGKQRRRRPPRPPCGTGCPHCPPPSRRYSRAARRG